MVDRFHIQESCRNPKVDTGWTEEFCKRFFELAGEDHSLHMVGKSAIRGSMGDQSAPGADFSTIIGCFLFKKKNAVEVGHQYSVILRPDLQIRQRQGQQFQQHHEVPRSRHNRSNRSVYIMHKESWCVPCRSRFRLDKLVAIFRFMIVIFQFLVVNCRMAAEVSPIFRNIAKSLTYNGGFFERMEQLSTMFFSKFSFTSNSDSHVSDGWCKQHILYTQYFTVCGSRLSLRFKTCRVCVSFWFFPILAHHVSVAFATVGSSIFVPPTVPFLSTSAISKWPFHHLIPQTAGLFGRLAIQSLLSWRRWRSTQITPRWSSFVKSETWCRWNSLLCRKISGIASSSWRCRKTSIGTQKNNEENCKGNSSSVPEHDKRLSQRTSDIPRIWIWRKAVCCARP